MHQLIYVSKENQPYTRPQLEELLRMSRENNSRLGITGILLYYKGHFFQVLEGEKETIFELFRTIRKDERHSSVILVYDQAVPERSFSDWTMAFIDLNKVDHSQLEGFSEFLEKGFTSEITQQHLTFAVQLLLKFKSSF